MSEHISRSEFKRLYDLLKEKWSASYPGYILPEKDVEILGWGKYSKGKGRYLRNLLPNGVSVGYLYNLIRQFQNPETQIANVTADKLDPFFKLVKLENLSEFRKLISGGVSEVTYHGFYYSFIEAETREFQLTIKKFWDGRMSAVSAGFYDNKDDKIKLADLEGTVKLVNETLIVQLERGKYYQHFMLQTNEEMESDADGKILPSSKLIQGMLSAVSKKGFLINVECILLNKDMFSDQEEVIHAKRYLTLKRRHHRIFTKETNKISAQNLTINGIFPDDMKRMAGRTYRIWNYSFKGGYIWQSKFSINDEYFGTIETPDDDMPVKAPLTCHITINRQAQLEVSAFRKKTLSLFALLDIPHKKTSVVRGVFLTTGNDKKLGANCFVMRADDLPFTAEKIRMTDLPGMIKKAVNKEELIELQEALDVLPRMHLPETKTAKKVAAVSHKNATKPVPEKKPSVVVRNVASKKKHK